MPWSDRYGPDDELDLAGALGAAGVIVLATAALAGAVWIIRHAGSS